jgi:hypothetical protein
MAERPTENGQISPELTAELVDILAILASVPAAELLGDESGNTTDPATSRLQ